MARFLITYDLRKKTEFSYKGLWDEFDRLGAVKTQESVYLIVLNNVQEDVFQHFKNFVHQDDLLLVIEFSKAPSYTKGLKGTRDWIASQLW